MRIPARRPLLALASLASGLLSVMPLSVADDAVFKAGAIDRPGAVPLGDEQLGELRGTAGALAGWLQTLIGSLPPGNTVSATVGSQDTVTQTGTGPQSLSCSTGITCSPGTSITLFSNSGPTSHVTVTTTSSGH
jgi:hypothetical protein